MSSRSQCSSLISSRKDDYEGNTDCIEKDQQPSEVHYVSFRKGTDCLRKHRQPYFSIYHCKEENHHSNKYMPWKKCCSCCPFCTREEIGKET